MAFHHPTTGEVLPIFSDEEANTTMLRIVVKSSLTRQLAGDLVTSIEKSVKFLLTVGEGYAQLHEAHSHRKEHKAHATANYVVC